MKDFQIKLNSISPIKNEIFLKLESDSVKIQYPKNCVVIKKDQTCKYFYFIEKGLVRSFYYHNDKEVTRWFLKEGDIFTSFRSFINNSPSLEVVETIEDSSLIKVPYKTIYKLFGESHDFERLGRLIVSNYWLNQEEHLYDLKFKTALERFQSFSKSNPEIMERAPFGYIASYLDMTQETFSRVKKSSVV